MSRLPKNRRPVHPGKIFLEDVLEPLEITQKEAAERLGISYPRMNEIINGKRRVTPEDLWEALHTEDLEDIERIEPVETAAEIGT